MSMTGPRRLVLAISMMMLGAAGCGSPTGPDGFSLDGAWSGTWTFVSAGATVTDQITVMLDQDDDTTASGLWTAESGPGGELTLSPRTMTTGTLTITFAALGGTTCSTTTSVTGTASGSGIELAIVDPSSSPGICQWSTSNRFSLRKQ